MVVMVVVDNFPNILGAEDNFSIAMLVVVVENKFSMKEGVNDNFPMAVTVVKESQVLHKSEKATVEVVILNR